ncbi:MAG: hypothetical protein ACOC8E_05680 [Planctomycetota bacterium]
MRRGTAAWMWVVGLVLVMAPGCALLEGEDDGGEAAEEVGEAAVEVAQVTKPMGKPGKVTLECTRDARFSEHSTEANNNFGRSNRLRVMRIYNGHSELVLLDFDRDKLKQFVSPRRGRELSGELVLYVRQVQNGPGELHAATLQTASQWAEGNLLNKKAKKGDCCWTWARYQVERWKTADGKEVDNLRAVFYDVKNDKVTTVANSATVEVKSGQNTVKLELDDKVVRDLALNDKCKGLVLWHRHPQAKLDFFSRLQSRKNPRLVVVAK